MKRNETKTHEEGGMADTGGSKTANRTVAVRFLGAVLFFVALLSAALSAKAGVGPDIFEALLFISGIAVIAGSAIKKRARAD